MRSRKSGTSGLVRLQAFFGVLVVAAGCSSASTFGYLPDGGAVDGGRIIATSDGGTSATSDAGKKKDSGHTTVEEDEDAGPTVKDAGKKDSALPLTCSPGSVSSFTPAWHPPKALHSSACTAANAQLAVDCAFDPNADPTTCNTFANNTANDACRQCVYSSNTDTTYGPVILDANNFGSLNLAGCIAQLSGNTTSSGCGAKFQALQQCEVAACETTCPDPAASAQALADYNQCKTDSDSSSCSTYQSNSTCADTLTQAGGSAAACANGATFVLLARNLAKIFCSP